MNDLKNIHQTMSSREIAQLTGKRHDNVLRDIDKLNESYSKIGLLKVGESSYRNIQNKLQPEYLLTKMQTLDLMTGYNTELRIKVLRRWEELENKAIDLTDPDNILTIVQNWKIWNHSNCFWGMHKSSKEKGKRNDIRITVLELHL